MSSDLKGLFRKVGILLLPFIVLFLLPVNDALGATRGKIAGVIKDSEGNPLPGVNVMVVGTQRGAATGLDGEYFIINMQPGRYSISAGMVGFKKTIKTDVFVNSGRTTSLDFTLVSMVYEGEEVVITAERPIVEVDRTSTQHILNADAIKNAPIIQSVSDLAYFLPGVGRDSGNNMVIRGGDNADTEMYYDGIPMGGYSDINIFSVEEASITTGGLDAEFGNAQGGIINVVTKEGGERLHGVIEYGATPPNQKHWGANYWDDAYHLDNDGNSRLRWDDPAWANEVDSVTGRKVHEKIDYTDIWGQSIKIALNGPLFLKNLYFSIGTQFSQGPGGAMSVNRYSQPYTRNNWKVTYKPLSNLIFRTGGFYNWSQGYNGGTGVGFTTGGLGAQSTEGTIRGMRIGGSGRFTDDRNIFLPIDYASSGSHTSEDFMAYVAMTHMFSSSTYYDLRLYRFKKTRDNQGIPDTIIANGRTDLDDWFYVEGGKEINYTNASNIRTGLKLDFTSQVTSNHLVKAGVDLQLHDFWSTSITHNTTTRKLSRVAKDFTSEKGVTPTMIAAYLSDKMEFGGLVVNIGGRFDYFDWGTKFPVTYAMSKLSRPFNSYTRFRDLPDELWMKPDPLTAFSPRLGISHPITEKATIHFFYGHVYQLPSFNDMYREEWFAKNAKNDDKDVNKNGMVDEPEVYNRLNDASNRAHFGNPTLEYEKTTSFEMGIDWNFYQDYLLTMTTYYKSAENQARGGSTHQFWDPNRESTAPYVHIINNTQFEDAKGFEFLIKKRLGKYFSFLVSFSLGWATEGSAGERVRTYVPDGNFIENYYFERYNGDSNGDGVVDELDSGAEIPEVLSDALMARRVQAADDYIAQLREQGALIQNVEGVDGLYYVSTHYSSVGHPRDNISRRSSFGLITYVNLPDDFGPTIFGGKPFANINVNLVYRYHEGLPYQYTGIDGKALWRSAPLSSITDMRIEKSFTFGGLTNTIFLSISNLFNNKEISNNSNFQNVVSLPDYVNYGLEGYSPISDHSFDHRGKTDGQLYLGRPRSFSFGIRLDF